MHPRTWFEAKKRSCIAVERQVRPLRGPFLATSHSAVTTDFTTNEADPDSYDASTLAGKRVALSLKLKRAKW